MSGKKGYKLKNIFKKKSRVTPGKAIVIIINLYKFI